MYHFLFCLRINTTSINATDNPDIPGNRINKYSTPQTPIKAKINRNPFSGESILKAAMNASTKNTIARLVKNICKDANPMLS